MGLEGKLEDMPVLDLLRVMQRSARGGKLVFWNERKWALIWIHEGQAVSAVVLTRPDGHPLRSGEQAVFELCLWTEGNFRYNPDPESAAYPIIIRRPTGALIVEVLQRRKGIVRTEPLSALTLHTPLCVLPQMAGADEHIKLNMHEWIVLVRIGQQTTAEQVAAQIELSPEQVLMIVAHLLDCGLIIAVPLSNLPERRLTVDVPGSLTGQGRAQSSITNLTRAIRRRLQQIAVSA
jgi:hypothetical protein